MLGLDQVFAWKGRVTLRSGVAQVQRRCLRLAASAAVILASLSAREAHAVDAVVQQDGTPVVSWPAVGGRIVTFVDVGFPVVVIGR